MPPLLVLKLVATPLLVGVATLAARRWGPSIGGWIVALPLTSGPILFFLALDPGPSFAVEASAAMLLGLGAIAGFTVGYLAASRRGPAVSIVAASLAYLLTGLVVAPLLGLPFAALVAGVLAAILGVMQLVPRTLVRRSRSTLPAWDLTGRIVVGTVLVVGLTELAPLLGPVTSGLVSTFPVYVSVLAVFAHLHEGRPAALGVLRGLLAGLPGTVAFYVVVHVLLEPLGVGPAFVFAVASALIVSAIGLRRLRGDGTADAGTVEAESV